MASNGDAMYISRAWVPVLCGPTFTSRQISIAYRGERYPVFEVRGGFARVSNHFKKQIVDPEPDLADQTEIAKWVQLVWLRKTKPSDVAQPEWDDRLADFRIQGIPDVGEMAISAEDARILREYSARLLEKDICSLIEYGGKSKNRPGSYFVACAGETRVRHFTISDLND